MTTINSFRNEYYFLSNFYISPVTYKGVTYSNNESAFQSAKTLNKEIRKLFETTTPNEAKKLGRVVSLRPDWDRVKYRIMYEIVLAKFTQNKELKEKLLSTGSLYLEEGNTWGDTIWGTVKGKGDNYLGKILMRVREELNGQ